jgi:HAE1 family hydrophobic/amphiphilic exporter-1
MRTSLLKQMQMDLCCGLKDVARIEFGAYTYGNYTRVNGKPGINIAAMQLAGSNSNEIQTAIAEPDGKGIEEFPKRG